jgi:hypothetical protein
MNIEVKLSPRASRDEIAGWRQGVLLVKVSAPPVDGAANLALRKLLAKRLGIARGRVRIARGEKGPHKLVSLDADERLVAERLGGGG